ncbi:DNA polymerase/3'-5' exonuclease PolX [Bradyrhizobium sp. CIR3A]|nr:DNA polymerase/3'-5' exonuclease PolX [Bradyrhizobium sp. CIR3A]
MPVLDARGVASLLREYAQRTALRGGNPYRVKAYSRAADSLAALPVALDVLIAEDQLTEIPGVGDAIADIITKLHKTGSHPSLEKLRKEIPDGVLEMLAVPGLRPEKVLRLYQDFGITSLAELEAAAKDDRIKKAKGLGAALQTKILQNLAMAKSGEGRLHLHRAATLLAHAKESIRKSRPELKRVTIAGDFRRGCELVADLTRTFGSSRELSRTFWLTGRSTTMKRCLKVSTSSSPASTAVSSLTARRRRSACFGPFPILTRPSSAT